MGLDLFRFNYLPNAIATEIIDENQRTIEEQLASLRFYDLDKNCPTYAGLLPIRFYWFSDHIEIQSPGGVYGEATPENFPTQNTYRNPVLAEAMKVLGYVNKFGYGVRRAEEALAENGNPPAEFKFDPMYVLVRVAI